MEIKEKIETVFNDNITIAKQLGDISAIGIIEGIKREVLDVLSGEKK